MKIISQITLLATLLLPVLIHAAQPSAPSPIPAPLRDLQWGALNFLATTDTHGWHAGHLQQASYSADWGDYISFATHLRSLADAEGFDLLLVDTGDRIEGNGLYDASSPKGLYTFDIFTQQHIDILCSGNHELYKSHSVENERNTTAPAFADSYIASNLDVLNPATNEFEPLAPRFRKITTKNQGIRIMAFGFIFDFQQFASNARVQLVEDAIKESWFQEAIRDPEVDLFVVAGHVGADAEEYRLIFEAIRKQRWDAQIQFFAGHTHIRDFKKYDRKAFAMESGRYMETLGFLSIDGIKGGGLNAEASLEISAATPKVRRKYIDNNLYSLHHHSLTNSSTFDTPLGRNVSNQIAQARTALKLDDRHGCAPKDLWIDRVAIDDSNSIFRWLSEEMLPDTLTDLDNATTPKIVLLNSGAVRFDIFQGNFTRDAAFLVSPFESGFRQIKNVNAQVAKRLLNVLNNEAHILASLDSTLDARSLLPPEHITPRPAHPESAKLELRDAQKPLKDGNPVLFPGYTTHDDAGFDGDDTLHTPIPFVRAPNVVQSLVDFPGEDNDVQTTDVVYNGFIEPWIILALQYLGAKYDGKDTESVMEDRSMTDMMVSWIRENWGCE
ncbi:MAG: hypothetical protein Q9159_002155 [Coniocarpon cinnabarinum]